MPTPPAPLAIIRGSLIGFGLASGAGRRAPVGTEQNKPNFPKNRRAGGSELLGRERLVLGRRTGIAWKRTSWTSLPEPGVFVDEQKRSS